MSSKPVNAKQAGNAAQVVAGVLKKGTNPEFQFKRLLRFSSLLLVALVVCVLFAIVATIFNGLKKETVAMSPTGRIVRLVPLSEPIVNLGTVSNFLNQAMNDSFSLDFQNYHWQLSRARSYWTRQGYSDYEDKLKTAKWMDKVLGGEVMSFSTRGAWVQVTSGTLNGALLYTLEAPVSIEFSRAKSSTTVNGIMTVDVVRVSNIDNESGIQINRFILKGTQ